MRRVCIANPAFIGDVLFSSRLCDALTRAHPEVQIAFVARPPAHQLTPYFPGVKKTIIFDKRGAHQGFVGVKKIAAEIKTFQPDVFITPHRGWRMALLASMLGKSVQKVGFQGFWQFCYTHRAPYFGHESFFAKESRLLQALQIEDKLAGMRCIVEVAHSHQEIILAPGANWGSKRWPPEAYCEVAGHFIQEGWSVALTGGPDEKELCASISAQVPRVTNRCGETLEAAMKHMANATLVIANDSGLGHLARAVGTPTILIFGPTPSTVHELSKEKKTFPIHHDVDCAPCSPHGHHHCPQGHHQCMKDLPASQIIELAKNAIKVRTCDATAKSNGSDP